jgi:DNA-binding MarR family transcriptional regulator
MSGPALDDYLRQERRFAAMSFSLDEELGTHHGISSSDFVLLRALHEAGATEESDLAKVLSMRRSQLLMRVRPLQKLGIVQRLRDAQRCVVSITSSGSRLVCEASETAAALCAHWAAAIDQPNPGWPRHCTVAAPQP